jgi:hypothetical protein
LDFLYRVRLRCNYRETESFIRGATSQAVAYGFLETITSVVAHTMAFLETLVVGRIGVKAMLAIVRQFVADTFLEQTPVARRWEHAGIFT